MAGEVEKFGPFGSVQEATSKLGLFAVIAAGGYFVGRFAKGEEKLPALTTLAMTYVVFRALDAVWPRTGDVTTLPLILTPPASGAPGIPGVAGLRFPSPPPSKQTVDGYAVKLA